MLSRRKFFRRVLGIGAATLGSGLWPGITGAASRPGQSESLSYKMPDRDTSSFFTESDNSPWRFEDESIDQDTIPVSDGNNRRVHIPILMYHYISDPPKEANEIRRDLSLPGSEFELQLRYLVNEGYHSISMQDLITHIQQGIPLPKKSIVLTIDDGYKDAFTVALPLLQKYGFTGTFFVFTKPINEENREYLSWREVELMSAAGMEIGCHSYSHPDLTQQSDDMLVTEIVSSKKEIESHIQKPVHFFCYPIGAYDQRVVQVVSDTGYWASLTTQQGTEHSNENRQLLRRIRVHGEAGLKRFAASLNLNT